MFIGANDSNSTSQMKTSGDIIVETNVDKVWEIFAHDFENAYKWMASVGHSYGKVNGEQFDGASSQGRVCELSDDPNGMRASESFLAYDEASKSATVRIEIQGGPAVVPIIVNIMDVIVVSTGENSARVSMTIRSQLKPFGYLIYPLVKIGLKSFIKQIQEELKYYAENDAPHPRKARAQQKRAAKLGKRAANA